MLIDTHLHLVNEKFDIYEIIKRASDNGVKKLIVSGSDLIDNFLNLESIKNDNVFFTCGFHPEFAGKITDEDLEKLEGLLSNKKVVGVGEIGLDYHYGKDDMEAQKNLFKKQLELAVKHNLPVVIHTRDAFLDTYEILKDYDVKGVIHCFSGSLEVAKKYIDLGFLLGIGGVVTFKNSKLKEVVREIGLDNIVLETDSPYLSPFRGEKNEPCNIKIIAEFLSEYLDVSFEEVAKITTNNAFDIFDLD